MFAIVKSGGKQYVVRENETLNVEKLDVEAGKNVKLDVMLVGNEDGTSVKVGAPIVKGASVEAKVVAQDRTGKIVVQKYKNKTRYRRYGTHRQPFTKIQITKITA